MDNSKANAEKTSGNDAGNENSSDGVSTTEQLLQKHSRYPEDGVAKKRGRPKGSTNKSVQSKSAATGTNPEIDVELVKKTVASLLGIVDKTLTTKCYRLSKVIGCDDTIAKENAESIALTPDERSGISELTGQICQKYQIGGAYAHEVLLVVFLVGYGSRSFMAFRKLDALAKEKAVLMRGIGPQPPPTPFDATKPPAN